jgi:SpoVK/Ycf46/Vps4 family AAA+-type ATPase
VIRPAGIIEEEPGRNLDSLVKSPALEKLQSTLVHQWQIRDAFADVEQYGIKPTTMALFYGPPGNGKTMAAKMLASVVDAPLYRVACEGLIEAYLGKTEANMAAIMEWLKVQGKCVVLFDECEALFRRRQDACSSSASQAMSRCMQVFWQAVDRWDSPQMFLLATNLIDQVDDALLSRCELQVEFSQPTKEQAVQVVDYWAEVLHEYGVEVWGHGIRKQIKTQAPASFRSLWQQISDAVRTHIVNSH